MRTVALALALSMVLATTANAQPAPFSARIVEASTGDPITGATVLITGFTAVVKTGEDGRFTFHAPPEPPFQLIIVLPNGQVARPVDIKAVDRGIDVIPVHLVRDESVTVVGAAPSVASAPASGTSLLTAAQISSRAPENLVQALETVPGISAVSEGHATVPAIRGLARGRTLVLIDGARVTSERRVGPSATFSDPATFEGIDVARGPGSVAYGSDAIGGVISVRTRRAEPGSPWRVRGSATAGAGIPEARGNAEISKGLARGGLLVQGHVRGANDWRSPRGPVFNSGWRDRGIHSRFDYQLGPGVFSAGWQSDFGRDIERPRNNSHAVRFYYPYENSHRLTSSYELANRGGFQQLALTGFLGTFAQRTDQDRFATPTTLRTIERADVSANDFHLKGSAARALGRARVEFGIDLNGRFGLEATDALIRHDAAGVIISETTTLSIERARRTATGAYLQFERQLPAAIRLAAGGRGDVVATRNTGGYFGTTSTSNGAFSGFTSVTAGPFHGFSVTAQLSRGFRDPTLSDRYFRGPTGRGFVTGNPALRPETSLQLDLAARYAVSRTQVAVYLYQYRITDLVERYATAPDTFFFRNQGRARLRGFEFEARTEIGAGWSMEGGINIGRGVAPLTGASLDDVAPDSVFVMGRYDFGQTVFAQVLASYAARDDRPGPGEVAAPAARIVDASGGWKLSRRIELRANARNIFNETYYASPDPRWVYAPGRSGSLTLAFQF
ncbi:MAG TPA: TonB-dependent receptor [Vicinamibacterales bacterium]|nr:TonB-dependent receptor [Vicinamibacterales bacterium]